MGKQLEGDFLEWPRNGEVTKFVQQKASKQLLLLWKEGLKKKGYPPFWGDEIEYVIIQLDGSARRATLSLRQSAVLRKVEESNDSSGEFTAEFAKYMVEGMPATPYGADIEDMLGVEESMRERRRFIVQKLRPGEFPFTLSIFPRLGVADKVDEKSNIYNGSDASKKPKFPDDIVSSEARYQAAEMNIPARRQSLRGSEVPKFKDRFTDNEPIHLEETIFGPGHCGLQVTFQVDDEHQARVLHDQLIPIGPIMLALTAATPIYKGYLAETDTRWNQISRAVDDRVSHEVEMGPQVLPPRWGCNPTYVAKVSNLKDEYQLKDLALNKETYNELIQAGMDPLLARHFAHLFVRDPIMIAKTDVEPPSKDQKANKQEGSKTVHFDALNGTVWPHIRLKIPPLDDENIGWRVEFRAMETQITDFENAAFSIFLALLRRVILEYRLDFYMPLDQVQANMDLAHGRDLQNERFVFRTDFDSRGPPRSEPRFGRYTVNEIINGGSEVPGLLPLIWEFLDSCDLKPGTREALRPYLDLVRRRASGELWTAARWMREFVQSHKNYRQDSAVDVDISYDLMVRMQELANGEGRNGSGLF